MITVTAQNEFDLAGTESQNHVRRRVLRGQRLRRGGMCTSTWTWHMKKGTKSPTSTPPCM